jgi:tRNA pseudouridine55 synthase
MTDKSLSPYIFNIHKPTEQTSYDVIRHFKRNLPRPFGKIGHFGTLDPFASGVLLVGISGATRLMNYANELLPKKYEAIGMIGHKTPSADNTTKVCESDPNVDSNPIKGMSELEINSIVQGEFLGDYWQVPPHYSATKHEGKPLYEYAREGELIEKPAVKRTLYDFKVLHMDFPCIKFELTVSTGTYIRTFMEDFMKLFGTLGHLIELERTAVGHVNLSDSISENDWPNKEEGNWISSTKGLSPDQFLPFRQMRLSETMAKRLHCGQKLPVNSPEIALLEWDRPYRYLSERRDLYWLLNEQNELLGLGKVANGVLTPEVNFI